MLLTPEFIRSETKKEQFIKLDYYYISKTIQNWWINKPINLSNHTLKLQLISLLLSQLKDEDKLYFDQIGKNYIAGIYITNVFSQDDYLLALIVHEALCELFHLNDIKYPYEEHKALYLKPGGENYRDWGNGSGEINPHSDDLYEENQVDLLALTVCRDLTNTPTLYYMPSDILDKLTNDDINQLINIKLNFTSGKNVGILKTRERKLLEYNVENGIMFYMDFRIDNDIGERMRALNKSDQIVIDKMRNIIKDCNPGTSISSTGNFLIIANYKVLHAREVMNINQEMAQKIAHNSDLSNTPRLLYRSKGSKYNVSV